MKPCGESESSPETEANFSCLTEENSPYNIGGSQVSISVPKLEEYCLPQKEYVSITQFFLFYQFPALLFLEVYYLIFCLTHRIEGDLSHYFVLCYRPPSLQVLVLMVLFGKTAISK